MKTILTKIVLLFAISSMQLPAQIYSPMLYSASDPNYFTRVPKGKTYLVYDARGKKLAEFKSGQRTNMNQSCLPLPCPPPYGDENWLCWVCYDFTAQQPTAAGASVQNGAAVYNAIHVQPRRHLKEVPSGKTYIVYDSKGKKVAVFRSGQKTNMTEKCVQVICTGSDRSGQDVVCWKCPGFTTR
jgi:hypothetical protein